VFLTYFFLGAAFFFGAAFAFLVGEDADLGQIAQIIY